VGANHCVDEALTGLAVHCPLNPFVANATRATPTRLYRDLVSSSGSVHNVGNAAAIKIVGVRQPIDPTNLYSLAKVFSREVNVLDDTQADPSIDRHGAGAGRLWRPGYSDHGD